MLASVHAPEREPRQPEKREGNDDADFVQVSVPRGSIQHFWLGSVPRRKCTASAIPILARRRRDSVIRVTVQRSFFDSGCYFRSRGQVQGSRFGAIGR